MLDFSFIYKGFWCFWSIYHESIFQYKEPLFLGKYHTKYRAMEIIDELEHGKRNLYTGSIGYLTLDGDCDFNIVIRTALHKDGKYFLGAGGGITAESDLEFEYEETLQKAKAILEALR